MPQFWAVAAGNSTCMTVRRVGCLRSFPRGPGSTADECCSVVCLPTPLCRLRLFPLQFLVQGQLPLLLQEAMPHYWMSLDRGRQGTADSWRAGVTKHSPPLLNPHFLA